MRTPILPGSTIGILGGGTAGRGIALAAQGLGYRVHALDEDPSALLAPVAERAIRAPLGHARAALEVFRDCAIVLPALEQVPANTMAVLEGAGLPLRPAGGLLAIVQDRVLERRWLAARGLHLAPWRACSSLEQAEAALEALGGDCVLKPARRRGEATAVRRVRDAEELRDAWAQAGEAGASLEQTVDIEAELTVVVARTASGVVATYPAAESRRVLHDGVPRLQWSAMPCTVPTAHDDKARRLVAWIAERLRLEGLLAVELFLLADGQLVVNEMVPGPHPSHLGTQHACATGQYEQLVRAACDLPLGPTHVTRPVATAPLHADEWEAGAEARVFGVLQLPELSVHVYGVRDAAPGQRVAHLVASAATAAEAVQRVTRARDAMRTPAPRRPRPLAGAA